MIHFCIDYFHGPATAATADGAWSCSEPILILVGEERELT